MREIAELFQFSKHFDVTATTFPAYATRGNDREIFMTRENIHEKFREAVKAIEALPHQSDPMFMEFLRGERELPCTAWANPTYNVKGWKAVLSDLPTGITRRSARS